jgi:hypothetical protein
MKIHSKEDCYCCFLAEWQTGLEDEFSSARSMHMFKRVSADLFAILAELSLRSHQGKITIQRFFANSFGSEQSGSVLFASEVENPLCLFIQKEQ